jgi:hypothetical protein
LEGTYHQPIVRVGPYTVEAVKVLGAAGSLFEGIWAAADAEDGRSKTLEKPWPTRLPDDAGGASEAATWPWAIRPAQPPHRGASGARPPERNDARPRSALSADRGLGLTWAR